MSDTRVKVSISDLVPDYAEGESQQLETLINMLKFPLYFTAECHE